MKNQTNRELTNKFDELYPGGHTNFRIPTESGGIRLFLTRGKGARVWDVEGKEYVDYMAALGPNILGHCNPEYVQALKGCLDNMSLTLGSGILCGPADIELAEKIIHHVPCAERVKFCVTGSEAVQLAIRLARAYTKRRYFIRFENHYHGWIDNVLGGVVNPKASGKPFGMESEEDYCNTEGKDPEALEQSFILPWNDLEALEECLKKYGEEVAMIHCEPIVFNHFALLPRPGYLERMRELCTQYGIVLSFDEIITGFRVGLNGAQGRLGITPDIATFGKAIGGGAPCSMVAGKSEIMDLLRGRKVLGPGTFMGYPFGLEAALTTIKILERNDGAVYREMDRVQAHLTNGLKEIFKRRGIPVLIQGVTGGFFTLFGVEREVAYTDEDVAGLDMDMVMSFWKNMQDEGVIFIVGCRWYLSVAHNDADVDRTLEAADRALASL